MVFGLRDGQVYALCAWPDDLAATRDFLAEADPQWVTRNGTRVDFRAANGHATYNIVRDDTRLPTILLRRAGSVYEPVELGNSAPEQEAR